MLSRVFIESAQRGRLVLINQICFRGIRGVIKPIRTRLPKYRKDLFQLPPLTRLLTEVNKTDSVDEAIELRKNKVAVYKSYMPDNHNFTLLEALFHVDNDVNNLLQVIDGNLENMNSFYLGVSFEALDDMMRANLCDVATVIVAPEFKRICSKTLYKIRFFETDDLLKLIKCLSTVQMPEKSLIFQAALQMSRHLINDFDKYELGALGEALEQVKRQEDEKTSLLEAVKRAQKLLLESKLLAIEAISNK